MMVFCFGLRKEKGRGSTSATPAAGGARAGPPQPPRNR